MKDKTIGVLCILAGLVGLGDILGWDKTLLLTIVSLIIGLCIFLLLLIGIRLLVD